MRERNVLKQDDLHYDQLPIRGELFSPEEFVEQAKNLARSQRIAAGKSPDLRMLEQVRQNTRFLLETYQSINRAAAEGEPIPPAEEWFLDNFHVISEQLRGIQEDLPKNYYRELVPLASGEFQGYPRVYEIAMYVIAHTDSRLDETLLRQYIASFQTISVLTTGELWAIAILLRVGLMENLKRMLLRSDKERGARIDANRFAGRFIEATSQQEIDALLEERSRDPRRIGGAFALQLILRLREEPPQHFAAVEWLYGQFAKDGIDADTLIREKHQELAGAQLSVSNSIMSLRLLAGMDWSELVEDVSLVDSILRKDPPKLYSECDFATRDRYRHVIEEIAKRSTSKTEMEIAELALKLAEDAYRRAPDKKESHVGYYLISKGRLQLESLCGFRPSIEIRFRRIAKSHPAAFYQLPIVLLTFLFAAFAAFRIAPANVTPFLRVATAALCLIPGSALAILVVNWLVTLLVKPKVLPKLEFKDGIPDRCHSIVVLPTLLHRRAEARELVGKLEVLFLANNEDALDFALLTDFTDADTKETPEDSAMLAEAKNEIAVLNSRYPRAEGPRFHIFHRDRTWNPSENKWMGWERKRGKLEEFNRLLRGDRRTTYQHAEAPTNIRYVITLDTDTVLPRDAARKLIGTAAHPINRPVMDPATGQVAEGYGILQPRVSHSLESSNQTWFARIFAGYAGIDPYTTAVSDIYQDLFEEGSFVGKGLYDLEAFDASTGNRFPENTLLSHDLIEGNFVRTAIVTDIELFDDHPSEYSAFILRLHRWVRGDWQVARWLFPVVPGKDGRPVKNTLSWLNRWKLLDNLRRSLVSPALFAMLLLGWLFFPYPAALWSLVAVAIYFAPVVIQFLSGLLSSVPLVRWIGRLWALCYDAAFNAAQGALQMSFLANEAWTMCDAIVRTLWRMMRRRKLLEWVTAAQAERSRRKDLWGYCKSMPASFALSGASLLLIYFARPQSLPAAIPLIVLWMLAPLAAYATGRLTPKKERVVPEDAIPALRSYAREIWRYYDTFVDEENRWLPPDNFQEIPQEVIAHRTSPTNIAFLLLSNMAAYDFGYIGAAEFLHRTEKTIDTLTALRTFNGHLFNWYDTRTLQPLEPRYVSTVDSGNLAAAFIVLKQFTLRFALNVTNTFEPRIGRFEGVRDTFSKFLQTSDRLTPAQRSRIESLLAIDPRDTDHQLELLTSLNEALEEIPALQDTESQYWAEASRRVVQTHLDDYARPQDLPRRLLAVSREAEALLQEIDFRFLYNETRGIFSIGFNVSNGQLDRSSYDLFASEARLASFVAIAKGDIPQSHWFRMARALRSFGRRRILLSWSGSMFEYLMPLLFLRNEPNTLMDLTYRGAIEMQRLHGFDNQVPWGISEAAYNFRDLSQNYQYGPCGVPALGLKRGLSRDLVVAPYATFLALMVDPEHSYRNLEQLKKMGAHGRFGFYESLDFTPARLTEDRKYEVVRTFMAHHQGMSLIALDNVLHNDLIQKRFHADPAVEATELLLQEKMPMAVRSSPLHVVDERPELFRAPEPVAAREFRNPRLTPPRTQVLSNGNYQVMVTTTGGGYSECKGIRLNRWREDATRDHWGSFLYIKDLAKQHVWSAGYQPTRRQPDFYKVVYAEDKVEIRRRDGGIETELDIAVSTEDNVEIRRLTLINTTDTEQQLELTSYLEVVLNTAAADLAHPAFSNLFIETEYDPATGALLASRRPRGADEPQHWAFHVLTSDEFSNGVEFETDRAGFIGRNRSTADPHAMANPLSNTAGAVLDPIFSLRCKMEVGPYSRKTIAFASGIADSREQALALAEKHRHERTVHRVFELAAAHAQVLLRQLSIPLEETHLFQRIAGRLLYSDPSLRPSPIVLARNTRTQSALWPYGISGDLPICLVRVEDSTEIEIVQQLLRAHHYWRMKGLMVDLVILNEYPSSYFQELQEELLTVIRNSLSHVWVDQPGGVFLRRADLMSEEDRILLRCVARVEIVPQRGSLARQAARVESRDPLPPVHVPLSQYPILDPPVPVPMPELQMDNGYGGFTTDGREYVIRAGQGSSTPAPWINVISNPEFGIQISETGAGMTWSVNSRENQLTPWSNDACTDPIDSALYVRDEESGVYWSATPQPVPSPGNYVVAHGSGYTRFNSGGYGIDQEMLVFVPLDAPVKVIRFRLRNRTPRTRKLTVTYFAELVLGAKRSLSAPFIITSIDPRSGALVAVNPYNNEFAERAAFLWINDKKRTVTADRTFFLGAAGDLANPAAMSFAHLAGKVGAGPDPCAAVQGEVRLAPLSEYTVILLFGQAANKASVNEIVNRFQSVEAVETAYVQTHKEWDRVFGAVQVKTPEPMMDLLLNRWLLYQTYSCRFFSRSAFYQSGGAFGFRDQLQDSLAFLQSSPEKTRKHLLRAASRQFLEGDVQHWWHPPTGRGVRTRISDDLLWLPYCTAHYVRATGDIGVLEEPVPYLKADVLEPQEMEKYFQPEVSSIQGTLFEHCIQALEYTLKKIGSHGIPLMGSGDWNDGMNRLGMEGRGESVWLGWFLSVVLREFSDICYRRMDQDRAQKYKEASAQIVQAIEDHGWDGEWYVRGFDDDGKPFGSSENKECRIDSIAQSWAVLSHAADSDRTRRAMRSVEQLLIKESERLALLFAPPFVETPRDPGYIKGYLAGIRENGGHYNHAAAWLIAAFAELGDPEKALKIFEMCNPLAHSSDRSRAEKYKLEPYATAGDIYSHPSHMGRGGWSWYSGSAAWLYRAGIEWILGLRIENGNRLRIAPCIPPSWPGFEVTYRYGKTLYRITVQNDSRDLTENTIDLFDDGGEHTVTVSARVKA